MSLLRSSAPLPIAASRTVALGVAVATVGFPGIGLQNIPTTKRANYTKIKKQVHFVTPFVRLVYFVVQVFSQAFGQAGRRFRILPYGFDTLKKSTGNVMGFV